MDTEKPARMEEIQQGPAFHKLSLDHPDMNPPNLELPKNWERNDDGVIENTQPLRLNENDIIKKTMRHLGLKAKV